MVDDDLRMARDRLSMSHGSESAGMASGSARFGLSSSDWKIVAERFDDAAAVMAIVAIGGIVAKNPAVVTAAGAAGATASGLAHLSRKQAEEARRSEEARRQMERERQIIRDHAGDRYRDLDRGETSRNDLGDRMDRISRTA